MTTLRRPVSTGLRISMQVADGTIILRIAGAVDVITAPILAAHVANSLRTGAHTLLLDMRRVTSFGPDGCQVLARAHRTALPSRLAIIADHDAYRHPIEGCAIPIHRSVDEALAAHRGRLDA